jgi:hypothetical protein
MRDAGQPRDLGLLGCQLRLASTAAWAFRLRALSGGQQLPPGPFEPDGPAGIGRWIEVDVASIADVTFVLQVTNER